MQCDIFRGIEGIFFCLGNILGIAIYISEVSATRKCIASNTHHAFRDGDSGKAAAIIESIVPNRSNFISNRDFTEFTSI